MGSTPRFQCTECLATGTTELVHKPGCSFTDPAKPMPPARVVRDPHAGPPTEVRCMNCGHAVRWTVAGGRPHWTHGTRPGEWQGMRCPGRLTGAEPPPTATCVTGAQTRRDGG